VDYVNIVFILYPDLLKEILDKLYPSALDGYHVGVIYTTISLIQINLTEE
jgi:hypothetical protein